MIRIGLGYDVHPFAPAGERRPLVLGGVVVSPTGGLAGHSDADVLTHAICDALLGAVGRGDLGRHFPSSDPRWRGASSLRLLERVRDLLRDDAAVVANIDAVVIAQQPRLAPHAEAMARVLEETLALPSGAVHVKATSTDSLGALGRGEGIAAQAVALVERDAR